jgi:hypothetical protein
MQFTAKELRVIERMRQRQRRWPIERWIFLATSIGFCAITGLWLWAGIHFIGPIIRSETYFFDNLNQEVGRTDDKKMEQLILQQVQLCHTTALLITFLFPFWLVFAIGSLVRLVNLIANWRGDFKDSILLKLIDSQKDQAAENSHAS